MTSGQSRAWQRTYHIGIVASMKRPALALLGLLILPGLGRAATIEPVRGPAGRTDIIVSGELRTGDDERFATVAGAVGEDATVWLDGPGGSLQAGLRIGTAIRLKAWKTAVPEESTCASACGLIWLGGVQRSLGSRARIGFHAAWVETDGRKLETGSGNALVGSYLNRLGLTDAAIFYLTSAPPDDAAWLTHETATRVGIRSAFNVPGRPERTASAPEPSPVPPPAAVAAPSPRSSPPSPAPQELLAQLYVNFPWSVRLPQGPTCLTLACKVRLVAADAWMGADGAERRMVVGVAEMKDGCHACEAILGIGVFRLTDGAWRTEIMGPAVTGAGEFGVYSGAVSFVDGGPLGRIVQFEDGGMHMGVLDAITVLLMPVGGSYRRVLDVPSMHNLGGFCDIKETDCRKRAAEENYSSQIAVTPADGGMRIEQTFAAAHPIPAASWAVSASGVARQTAGGKASPGTGAQERASLASPGFDQGHADRAAYEAWFSTLQGEARAGAESWAGRRSLRAPGNCDPTAGQTSEWSSGCAAVRQMLTAIDSRRKADPEYRRGWNSL